MQLMNTQEKCTLQELEYMVIKDKKYRYNFKSKCLTDSEKDSMKELAVTDIQWNERLEMNVWRGIKYLSPYVWSRGSLALDPSQNKFQLRFLFRAHGNWQIMWGLLWG